MGKFKNKIVFLPIVFILLGSLFRLWFFWIPSFGGDEAGQMIKAVRVARGINDLFLGENRKVALNNISEPILQHNHPPLEFLVLLPSVPFHPREFSARLVYVVIGITTMILAYWVLTKIRSKKIALFFLALFSTSPYAIFFSQRTDFHLNITAGVVIGLAIIYFSNKPAKKSLYLIALAHAFALWVSLDYIFFLPTFILLIFSKRSFLGNINIIKGIIFFLFLTSLFYVPYIIYSFLPESPKNAGLNYYLRNYSETFNGERNILNLAQNTKNLLFQMWRNFFSVAGVFTIWPFAILGLTLWRKLHYLKYLILTIFLVIIFETPRVVCCTNYLNLFGLFILLGVEWLVLKKNVGFLLLSFVVLINLITDNSILYHNYSPFPSRIVKNDNIRAVSNIAKSCLMGDEIYLSTDDAWRTQYYFGKAMLPDLEAENISDNLAVEKLLKSQLPYNISFVHINNETVSPQNIEGLSRISKKMVVLGKDKLFILKDCN